MSKRTTEAQNGPAPAKEPSWLAKIRHLLQTQDNRATDAPIFAVMQKKRIYGVDHHYHDGPAAWFDDDHDPPESAEEAAKLEASFQETGDVPPGWRRVHYIDVDDFVTACFTEEAAKEHIQINGHNLQAPFIFAFGSFRNREWRSVRAWLMGAPEPR